MLIQMKGVVQMLTMCVIGLFIASAAQGTMVVDSIHYSEVMGENRHYRIFLPTAYDQNTSKKYSVIYFYHGWSQRYFGSLNRQNSELQKPTEEELIADLVEQFNVIVVKPDGYNADADDAYYLRPYNIGPVETHRQFALYFPEFVDFIDANYRTIAERDHRGIMGYSMGGFMAFWIAGKYPQLVTAAGSFCGSPEFVIGPKDFPVEYYHGDMYGNYDGVRLRLNYGREDFIRAYHKDLNAIFTNVLENYEVQDYPGGHALSGLEDMFDFFSRSFNEPLPRPEKWSHIDVYPVFEIWDYRIFSDRDIPGFTVLENVNKRGFRSSVRPFLPDGKSMAQFNLVVQTAPLYQKNKSYSIRIYSYSREDFTEKTVRSDRSGSLFIALNGGINEVAIFELNEKIAVPVIHTMEPDTGFGLEPGEGKVITVEVLNMGTADLTDGTLEFRPYNAEIHSYRSKIEPISLGSGINVNGVFTIPTSIKHATVQKFDVVITDSKGREWQESKVLPVRKGRLIEPSFEIADGRIFTYLSRASDAITAKLGYGNGDGQINPGETFMILVEEGGIHRLTRLSSPSPYIDLSDPSAIESDSWVPFDHVGGSFKYSIPTLSSSVPEDEMVDLDVMYWIPDYPDHIEKSGRIKLRVSGNDKTAPKVERVTLGGDNIIRAQIVDGGKINKVMAELTSVDDPGTVLKIELYDSGEGEDRVEDDHVFTRKIKVPYFGKYTIVLYVEDEFRNSSIRKLPEHYVFFGQDLK